jgi:hypothetical protein
MVKKNEVAERPVNEKRFCKKCEYYYSEFFTCPICYGEKRAEERIIKLLDDKCERPLDPEWEHHWEDGCRCALVALIEGETK